MPTKTSARLPVDALPLVLLDTHIAVWLADGNSRLKPGVISLLEQAFDQGKICLSPISAWEIGVLVSKNRLDLGRAPLEWFNSFVDQFNAEIIEITPDVAIKSSYLPGKFHGDPADRILAASALTHSATLVSADRQITAYGKQGFLKVIAC